jgi:hypothetical protein
LPTWWLQHMLKENFNIDKPWKPKLHIQWTCVEWDITCRAAMHIAVNLKNKHTQKKKNTPHTSKSSLLMLLLDFWNGVTKYLFPVS